MLNSLVSASLRLRLVVLALAGLLLVFGFRTLRRAPLDVFVVRKLGVPGHRELAMGAIASGNVLVVNRDVVEALEIPEEVIEQVAQSERVELARREAAYRGQRPPPLLAGRIVFLVDDGLATGSTMRAAVKAVRQFVPSRVIVAVPVAAPSTAEELGREVDELVCPFTPDPFSAVGQWYEDFSETTDEEVRRLLE